MIEIDGRMGEGGGQVLRTALALSVCTGQPFRMAHIRAERARPGLQRQHLTCVEAAEKISDARVDGAALGATSISFIPGLVKAGDYTLVIGTAGSTSLVLQTVLPPLLHAGGSSNLVIKGGTHNPLAPPYDFLERAFLPLLRRMGAGVSARLQRPGFYPAGGGEVHVAIEPGARLQPLHLIERGISGIHFAEALVAGLPIDIAQRELAVVGQRFGWPQETLRLRGKSAAIGPGNALMLVLQFEHVTEVFCGVGERGRRAEAVAASACDAAAAYLASDATLGEHLADQLLIPLGLAGAGSFTTTPPSLHTRTNAEVIARFLPVRFQFEEISATTWRVRVANTTSEPR